MTLEAALEKFQDGQTIMFGDWHGELSAEEIITGLLEKGVKDIEAIAVSGGMPDQGVGRLINEHRVNKLITTHIGLNPVAGQQMFAGELEVEFVPQGTFAERIRCGGAGLGGVLTKTGLGTVVEEGKQIIEVNGESYLLETALRADIALTRCRRADPLGNLAYSGSSGHASHPVIATCGALSIVECDHFCDLGELGPDEIKVPGMFVDMILA